MPPKVRDHGAQKTVGSHRKIEASIGYRVSSRPSWACLRKQTTKEIKRQTNKNQPHRSRKYSFIN